MVEATIEDLAITNGVINLHGSKAIPKSRYKAFWYHGNRDASMHLCRLPEKISPP